MRIKIEKQLKTCYKFTRDTVRAKDTAFTTVVHRDLWINNVMIKKGNKFANNNKKTAQTLYSINSLKNVILLR